MQFREIPGPAYVSADVPGRGIRPRNAFALKNGVGAVPNIGPIKNATAYGEPHFSHAAVRVLCHVSEEHSPSDVTPAEARRSTCWLAAAAFAGGPTLTCHDAGAPGWSNSSTRALSRQIPSTAASTTSVGSVYSASTFQVDDGAQCGGTGGEPSALCADNRHRATHLQL